MPRKRPVVGIRGAREARLSAALKDLLRRRSEREARDTFRPEIQMYRRMIDRLQTKRSNALSGVRQSINSGIEGLDSSGLRRSGLSGRPLRQVQDEFAARRQGLRAAVPFLAQDVRADYASQIADARMNLIGAKVDRTQAMEETYASALDEARTEGEQAITRRRAAKADAADTAKDRAKNQNERQKVLREALIAGNNLLSVAKKKPWEMKDPDLAWDVFTQELLKSEAVDSARVARLAVQVLKRRLDKRGTGEDFAGASASGPLGG